MLPETFRKKTARTREIRRLTVELPITIEQRHQGVEVVDRALLNLE